jgi:hypothetical protein
LQSGELRISLAGNKILVPFYIFTISSDAFRKANGQAENAPTGTGMSHER